MEPYDLLIHNGLAVMMEGSQEVFPSCCIGIREGRIASIMSREEAASSTARETLDASGCIVMPGFINGHTHAAMTMLRGFADDLSLKEWLTRYIWPAENRGMTRENVRLGTRLALLEMIASGTVMFADMYFFEDEVARVCEEAGMRVLIGEGLLGFPTPSMKSAQEAMDFTRELAIHYKNHERVKVAYAPHSIYTCSDELLKEIAQRSASDGIPVHIHLSETRKEFDDCLSNHGLTPTAYLHSMGLLNSSLIAAHMVHITPDDIQMVKASGAGIVHNPSSNLKLASGFGPVGDCLSAGIPMGLGTDGAAANNNLSIPTEIRMTSLVNKLVSGDPRAMNARQAVYMATLGGARVLGADSFTGSIRIGKSADLIVIPLNKPHLQPVYDLFSHLAYCLQPGDVRDVIIHGLPVYRNSQFTTLDPDHILQEVRTASAHLHKAFHHGNLIS